MKCNEVKEYLINLVPREIPNLSDDKLKEHLKKCSKCRTLLNEYEIFANYERKKIDWEPSEIYWTTLLPRIHMHISRKKEITIPSWIYKILAPVAGMILIIFISLSILKINGGDRDFLPRTVLNTDIEEYYQQKLQENQYDFINIGESDTLGIDDVIIIQNLLNEEKIVASYYEEKAGSLIETISEDEASRLLAMLDENFNK